MKVVQRTYTLKTNNANGLVQLVTYDGSTHADVPIVDHVVGLTFEYFGDPPPAVCSRLSCSPKPSSPTVLGIRTRRV